MIYNSYGKYKNVLFGTVNDIHIEVLNKCPVRDSISVKAKKTNNFMPRRYEI
jgi:Fe2+ transport system protein FeoA